MNAFNFRMHVAFSVFLWFLFFASNTLLNPLAMVIGAVFPDTDISRSPAGRLLPLWLIPGVRHRGVTHTCFALILTTLAVGYWFGNLAGLSWFFGYGSHLFADATTPMGVKFWTLRGVTKRRYR